MAKAEWGVKRTCQSCGARFYDMRRDPIICPVCQSAFDPDRQPRPRRPGPVIKDEPALASGFGDDEAAPQAMDDDAADSEGAEADEDAEDATGDLGTDERELMEDTSELGADDDDIGEVMEHIDDEADEKP